MFRNYLKLFALGALMATSFPTTAADDRLEQIENAYQSGDSAALTELAEQAAGNNKYVAQYRLASMYLGNKQMTEAKTLLNDLRSSLEEETSANPNNAEAWALLASSYGMLTTIEQGKTVEYGQNASIAEGASLTAGDNNPMVLLLTGINKFYTPEQWGGGKARALTYFDRAISAYQSNELERSWGHADALVWRGSTHAKLGNSEKAKADLNAAIAMEPDYQWAKNIRDSL